MKNSETNIPISFDKNTGKVNVDLIEYEGIKYFGLKGAFNLSEVEFYTFVDDFLVKIKDKDLVGKIKLAGINSGTKRQTNETLDK